MARELDAEKRELLGSIEDLNKKEALDLIPELGGTLKMARKVAGEIADSALAGKKDEAKLKLEVLKDLRDALQIESQSEEIAAFDGIKLLNTQSKFRFITDNLVQRSMFYLDAEEGRRLQSTLDSFKTDIKTLSDSYQKNRRLSGEERRALDRIFRKTVDLLGLASRGDYEDFIGSI